MSKSWYAGLEDPVGIEAAQLINRLADRLLAIGWFMHHLPQNGEGRKSVMVCIQKKPADKLCDCGCPSKVRQDSMTSRLASLIASLEPYKPAGVYENAQEIGSIVKKIATENVDLTRDLRERAQEILKHMPLSVAFPLYENTPEKLLTIEDAWNQVEQRWRSIDECEWKKWSKVGRRAIEKETGTAGPVSDEQCKIDAKQNDTPCIDDNSPIAVEGEVAAAAATPSPRDILVDSLQQQLEDTQAKLESCNQNLLVCDDDLKHLKRHLADAMAALENSESEVAKTQSDLSQCKEEVNRLKKVVGESEAAKLHLESELATAMQTSEAVQSRLTQTSERYDSAVREGSEAIAAKEVEIAAITTQLRNLEESIKAKDDDLAIAQRVLQQLDASKEAAMQEHQNCLAELEKIKLREANWVGKGTDEELAQSRKQLEAASQKLASTEAELLKVQKEHGEMQDSLGGLKRAAASARESYDRSREDMLKTLADTQKEAETMRAEYEQRIKQLDEERKDNAFHAASLDIELGKLREQMQTERADISNTEALKDAQNRLVDLEQRLNEQLAARAACDDAVQGMRRRLGESEERARKCTEDKAALTASLKEQMAKARAADDARNVALLRVGSLESQIRSAQEKVEEFTLLVASSNVERDQALADVKRLTAELNASTAEILRLTQRAETAEKDIEQARADLAALRRQVDERLEADAGRDIVKEMAKCQADLKECQEERDRLLTATARISELQGRLDAAERQVAEMSAIKPKRRRPRQPVAEDRSSTPPSPRVSDAPSTPSSPRVSDAPLPGVMTPQQSEGAPIVGDFVDTTHAPFQEAGERVGPTPAFDGRMLTEERRRDDGSLRAMMLGTACDSARIDEGEKGVPAACARGGRPSDERCTSPAHATSGMCNLWTIPVPLKSPLGGNEPAYEMFRALDPGTQIKMHLHNARVYWSQGSNLYIWASPVALDRNLRPYRRSAQRPSSIAASDITATTLGGPIAEFDDLLEAMELAKSVNDSYGTLAPEYARLISESMRESMPETKYKGNSGFYEARPLWRNGTPDLRIDVQPKRCTILKTDKAMRLGSDLIDRGAQHLYNALCIATYYTAGQEATVKGLVGPDGVPNGAMSFLHDNEMQAMTMLAQALNRFNDAQKSGTDAKTLYLMHTAFHKELLRFLSESMRTVDLQPWFFYVMSHTAVRRSVVSEWRDALRVIMPEITYAMPRLKSDIAEIRSEGGRTAAENTN